MNPFVSLRAAGVLGMNERNARYIQIHNPRRLYPLVDDKVRTKRLAEEAGIAVPRLFAVLQSGREAWGLDHEVDVSAGFVVKPAHGSGGNGIVVVTGPLGGHYRRSNGTVLTRDDLVHHVGNIISGMHSLGAQRDVAMIEQRVEFDPMFDEISYRGVPDIRTVVYRGVPVMAMLRLPTQASGGKANLHLGGVGVGIDLASGVTAGAVCRDRVVTSHPDTLAPVEGIPIPGWPKLLELAARCQALCGLGYLGVDVVLDRDAGPMMLELNARPGLSVQLANRIGLRKRLDRVDAVADIGADAVERAALAHSLFTEPGAAA